ncbi:hypothetical protein [[Eubacterium] hominis]|uniref:hypothetical protein n=1 Tax=[Eubacterium] hominis TaxID=2764325 RepID=UPI003A4D5605
MNKDKFINSSKSKNIVFFSIMLLVVISRLIIGVGGVNVVCYFFESIQFIILPGFMCYLLYRINCYYQNIFTRIRYQDEKAWRESYLKDCLKPIVIVVTLFYLNIIIFGFESDVRFFIYTVILFVFSILVFVPLIYINVFLSMSFRKKNTIYCLLATWGIFLYTLFRNVPQFYSPDNVFSGDKTLILVMIFTFVFDALVYFIYKYKITIENLNKINLVFILSMMIFIFQNMIYRNYNVKCSFGFPDIYFMSINDIISPLIMWLMQIALLVGIMSYIMLTNYRSHFLFYAIRIRNRTSWFLSILKKGVLYIALVLIIKYGVDMYFNSQELPIYTYLTVGILWTSDIALLLFLIYQVLKEDKLFSYSLIAFILLIVISITTGVGESIVLMRLYDVRMIACLALFAGILVVGNSYALKYLDYY